MIKMNSTGRMIVFGLFVLCVGIVTCQTTEKQDTAPIVESWRMEYMCGQTIYSRGGELHFDSANLRGTGCTVYYRGIGPNDTMLSMFFMYLNFTDGCLANVSVTEPSVQQAIGIHRGLSLNYCKTNVQLNPNSMFTTFGDTVTIKYQRKDMKRFVPSNSDVNAKFVMKISTFTSRYGGCSADEITSLGMKSCDSGRCVHESLVCKDLNPCGNHRDCMNSTDSQSQQDNEGQGLEFVKVTVIIVAVVFGMFAFIQICLILRNNKKVCGWHSRKKQDTTRDGAGIEAAFIPINGEASPVKNGNRSSIEATFVRVEQSEDLGHHLEPLDTNSHHHRPLYKPS